MEEADPDVAADCCGWDGEVKKGSEVFEDRISWRGAVGDDGVEEGGVVGERQVPTMGAGGYELECLGGLSWMNSSSGDWLRFM